MRISLKYKPLNKNAAHKRKQEGLTIRVVIKEKMKLLIEKTGKEGFRYNQAEQE